MEGILVQVMKNTTCIYVAVGRSVSKVVLQISHDSSHQVHAKGRVLMVKVDAIQLQEILHSADRHGVMFRLARGTLEW